MNWLSMLVEQTNESEAPERFFWWSGIAALSATVKKNIWMERHYYKLYPNVYVFLVAHSGAKKSIPITTAKKIVEKAEAARVISGRNSVQRIIKDLGIATSSPNGQVSKKAQAMLVSGELASFFVKDPDAMTILTDLHDTSSYEKEWKNSLKGTGIDVLHEPCITLLAASNEEHFGDAVADKDIKGGFIARTFIVFSREVNKLNSLTEKPKQIPNIECLSKHLRELSKIKGEFVWTKEGKEMYDSWYYPYMGSRVTDPTGTVGRIGDQIIKVAMLISLAHDFDLKLKSMHVHQAIAACLECFNGTRQVTLAHGKGTLSYAIKVVMRKLLSTPSHQIERAELLQEFWGDFDAFELDRLTETLVGSGAVTMVKNGKQTIYKLNKIALETYGDFVKEIN